MQVGWERAQGRPVTKRCGGSSLERRLFYLLAATALIYAFLAGLRTVKDYDLG